MAGDGDKLSAFELQLSTRLDKRKNENGFRQLSLPSKGIDFSSNDYLGMAKSAELSRRTTELIQGSLNLNGSSGSRLLGGNSILLEEAEKAIADFHGAEAALIFNSGYDANLGLFSTICGKHDTIIYDEYIHASIRDGIRLSFARAFSYKHNNLVDLYDKLSGLGKNSQGNIFIAVESLYSMDGDMAPLKELAEICKPPYYLIIDEAHANGLYGEKGEGLAQGALAEKCLARIYTFGKALGLHGAAIMGSKILADYLVNFCRPFIFTTALPPNSVAGIKSAYEMLPVMNKERAQFKLLSSIISSEFSGRESVTGADDSPIRTFIFPGNDKIKLIAADLRNKGFDVKAVLSPTVPQGNERIRICLHAYNTEEEVRKLCKEIKNLA